MKFTSGSAAAILSVGFTVVVWAQAPAKQNPPPSAATKPGASAEPKPEAALRSLSDATIAKGSSGEWKCLHAGGAPCTGAEVQALRTVVTKSRSNVKDNLRSVSPNGTLTCGDTGPGKACSDSDIEEIGTVRGVVGVKVILGGGKPSR